MLNPSEFDLNATCRTCLSIGEMKSLYDKESNEQSFAEMLMSCTSVEYYGNDGLPTKICLDCVSEISRSYKFSLKCRESDDKLQKYLQTLNKAKKIDVFNYTKPIRAIKSEANTALVDLSNTSEEPSTHTPQMNIKYDTEIQKSLRDPLSVVELQNILATEIDIFENKIYYAQHSLEVNENEIAQNCDLNSIKTEINHDIDYSLLLPTISDLKFENKREIPPLTNDPLDLGLNEINKSTNKDVHLGTERKIKLLPQTQNNTTTKIIKSSNQPKHNLNPFVYLERINLNMLLSQNKHLKNATAIEPNKILATNTSIKSQPVRTKKNYKLRKRKSTTQLYSEWTDEDFYSDSDLSIDVDFQNKKLNPCRNKLTDEKIQQTELLNTSNKPECTEVKLPENQQIKTTSEQSNIEVSSSVAVSTAADDIQNDSLPIVAEASNMHYALRKRTCTKSYSGFADEDCPSDSSYNSSESESSNNEDDENDRPNKKQCQKSKYEMKPVTTLVPFKHCNTQILLNQLKQSFKCLKCDLYFPNEIALQRHSNSHAGIAYICSICDKACESMFLLRNHMHPSCSHCKKIFGTIIDLECHMQEYHAIFATESNQRIQSNNSNDLSQVPSNKDHELSHFTNDQMKLLICKNSIPQSNALDYPSEELNIANGPNVNNIKNDNELVNIESQSEHVIAENPQQEGSILNDEEERLNGVVSKVLKNNNHQSDECQNQSEQLMNIIEIHSESVSPSNEISERVIIIDDQDEKSNNATNESDTVIEQQKEMSTVENNQSEGVEDVVSGKPLGETNITKPFSCSKCELKFSKKAYLNAHVSVHNDVKRYKCGECGSLFRRSSYLKKHMLRRHTGGAKKYSCPICKKEFTCKSYVLDHKGIHDKEPKYSCTICQKPFFIRKVLYKHMRLHTTDGYICPVCGKKFLKSAHFQQHLTIHSDERPFPCTKCDSTFKTKSVLRAHVKATHCTDAPLKCDICNRLFKHKTLLRIHMRMHSGLKPYQCSLCSKSFRKRDSLERHMRSHTNERPYPCSVCDKSFKAASNLELHMRTHKDDRPYACTLCDLKFKIKHHLRAHIERKHPTKD